MEFDEICNKYKKLGSEISLSANRKSQIRARLEQEIISSQKRKFFTNRLIPGIRVRGIISGLAVLFISILAVALWPSLNTVSVSANALPNTGTLVTNAVSALYQGKNTQIVGVKKTDRFHFSAKSSYIVTLHGSFTDTNSGHGTAAASMLQVYLTDGGDKLEKVTAYNASGAVLWQADGFSVNHEDFTLRGVSAHWQGMFHVNEAVVWTKGLSDFTTWGQQGYQATYTGENKAGLNDVSYYLNFGGGSSGLHGPITDGKIQGQYSGGNIGIYTSDMPVSMTFQWNGQKESFRLTPAP